MCSCEWLSRVVAVDRISGTISIRKLSHAHLDTRRYHLQPFFNSQLPHTKYKKYLTCKNVLDCCTGWASPHLLVTHTPHEDCTTHELLVCGPSSGEFEACGLQFDVKEDDLPTEDLYHLLDGPTVVWKRETRVHIVHGANLEQVSVDVQKSATNLKVEKVREMWCVRSEGGDGGDHSSSSILLLLQLQVEETNSYNYREFGAREWVCLQVQLRENSLLGGYAETEVPVVRVQGVIPPDYGCIATCVAVHRWFHVDERGGALVERVVYLVGTEYRQVVLVEGGMVRQVIPLQDLPLSVVPVKGFHGNVEVAVILSNGSARVYEVTESGPKDKGKWTGIATCLAGDFLYLGYSQILMLPGEELPRSFYLTENNILSTDHPTISCTESASGDMQGTGRDAPESLLSVLRAIQLKKHTVGAQLTHHELTLQHKYNLLARGLGFMESLGKGGDAVSSEMKADPSLVCLIPGKVDGLASGGDLVGVAKQLPDLQVLKVWQRVSEGKWLIGILVRNDSGKVLTGVGASLLVGCSNPLPKKNSCRVVWREPITSQSIVSPLFTVASSDSPPKKRLKLELLESIDSPMETEKAANFEPVQPKQSFCLAVASDEISPGVEAMVIGFWGKDGSEEVQTGELAQVQLTTKALCSGELSIDERCLSLWNGSLALSGDGKLHTKEGQDLGCLLASHLLTQVLISTDYTHLFRLPSIIRARLPLSHHALQLSGTACTSSSPYHRHHARAHHQYPTGTPKPFAVERERSEVLEGTALHLQIQSESAVVSILHRSQSHLNLVLKLLKELLPDDVHFCPMSEAETTRHQHLLLSLNAIREEASNRAKTLRAALALQQVEEGGGCDRSEMVAVASSQGDFRLVSTTDATVKAL